METSATICQSTHIKLLNNCKIKLSNESYSGSIFFPFGICLGCGGRSCQMKVTEDQCAFGIFKLKGDGGRGMVFYTPVNFLKSFLTKCEISK